MALFRFRPVALTAAGLLLIAGLVLSAVYFWSPQATLRITTGLPGTAAHRFVGSFAKVLTGQHPRVRFDFFPVGSLADSAQAMESGKVDLALVRSDVSPPTNGRTIAIMRRDVDRDFPAGRFADRRCLETRRQDRGDSARANAGQQFAGAGRHPVLFRHRAGQGEARFSPHRRDRSGHTPQTRVGGARRGADRSRRRRQCRRVDLPGDQGRARPAGDRSGRRHRQTLSRLRIHRRSRGRLQGQAADARRHHDLPRRDLPAGGPRNHAQRGRGPDRPRGAEHQGKADGGRPAGHPDRNARRRTTQARSCRSIPAFRPISAAATRACSIRSSNIST